MGPSGLIGKVWVYTQRYEDILWSKLCQNFCNFYTFRAIYDLELKLLPYSGDSAEVKTWPHYAFPILCPIGVGNLGLLDL